MTAAIKTVLSGKQSVGKTALVCRYMYENFDGDTQSTIGAAYYTKEINNKDKKCKLNIWDTAGTERFASMMSTYYRHANLILLCFDTVNTDSLNTQIRDIREIEDNAKIILVMTKYDIATKSDADLATNYAKQTGHKLFFTSAKTGYGISELFDKIIDMGCLSISEAILSEWIVPLKSTNNKKCGCQI